MDKRYDAMNMITLDIPVEPMQGYINSKRGQGCAISHMGLVVAAYLRTAAEYPRLNRFIVNKRIYQRNEFHVAMVVLKPGHEDSTMSKVRFEFTDDVFMVQKKIDEYVGQNREEQSNSTDRLAQILINTPGLLSIGIWAIKWLDRRGWLPRAIIDASPFHTSLTISNLASIRTNHIYHHCYEFGTTSVFITLGNLREVPVREKGKVVFKRSLPLGVVMDERICSGQYFANACKSIYRYLADPSLMEAPLDMEALSPQWMESPPESPDLTESPELPELSPGI
ncbi:MAG: 2-oxo acid dehydrogenase subunit E2 [Bacillota bacterium]|nr:2-oxo acid dehydrogenase subunit E2 [Bacillota bacterium]